MNLPNHNGAIHQLFEDKDNALAKSSPEAKHYTSLLEYSKDVADELPQRQAFYTIDLEDVLWKVQEWKKFLSRVEIFYAVKANTDPVLLQLLTHLGLSFDCASQREIEMVIDAGASPNNIVFSHTIKTVEALKFASELGVEMMTFDNEDELRKIHRVYPNAKLLIRLKATAVNCLIDLSKKFACTEDEALKLIKLAHQLNVSVIGVSFHVGTLCKDPCSYTSTIAAARRIFDAAKIIGFNFTILDIGGGFSGSSETRDLFYKIAEGINESLRENFPDNQVRIIGEPGTYIVCSAANLVSTVIGKRCFDDSDEVEFKRGYFINDGRHSSFFKNVFNYGAKLKHILAESEIEYRPKYESQLYGQTGALDLVMEQVVLPDLEIGDRIIWSNMGAYCLTLCSTFCGVVLPVTRHVFVHKQRLNTNWIAAKKTISDFLQKHVTFIGCTKDDI